MADNVQNTVEVDEIQRYWTSKNLRKTIVLYITMVSVSTLTIFLLEHTAMVNAFRTALVAAIGKTLAANWVSGIFD